jgi:hypothetical protein
MSIVCEIYAWNYFCPWLSNIVVNSLWLSE